MMKLSGIWWQISVFYLLIHVNATPLAPEVSASTNTHIISFVAQKKTNAKYAKINNFNIENFDKTSSTSLNGDHQSASRKLVKLQSTDDIFTSSENTLENTNNQFVNDTQHESSKDNKEAKLNGYQRFKQSIPVLEPVRHLLNAVREGNLNHSSHFNHSTHHLVNPSKAGGMDGSSESSAIETMADRETVENSISFNVLDFLGRIGGKIWSFLMNIFAASSGNAGVSSNLGGSL